MRLGSCSAAALPHCRHRCRRQHGGQKALDETSIPVGRRLACRGVWSCHGAHGAELCFSSATDVPTAAPREPPCLTPLLLVRHSSYCEAALLLAHGQGLLSPKPTDTQSNI